MAVSSLPDTTTFQFTGSERPPLLRLLMRTVVINELVALPVALIMSSVNGDFAGKLDVASVYSQTIGLTCAMVVWLMPNSPTCPIS